MYNYKGIFYKEEKEKKYYEGGAHFRYSELVSELNKLKERNNDNENIQMNSSRDSKEIIFLSNNYQNVLREVQKSKSIINKQKKMKLNLLTINNNDTRNKNVLDINQSSKLILKTEKNDENRQNSQKNKLLGLVTKNMKMLPLKANLNNKGNNLIENNYNLKTLANNGYKRDIYKNISLYVNHNKEMKNNLPIIKDFHHNNFSNKNIFKLNKNNSKFEPKVETSKYNLFLKSKVLSPLKNIQSNRENKILSVEFCESKYDKNTIDAVSTNKNKFYLSKGKLSKLFKEELNKQKNKPNINIINFTNNKKKDI